MLLICIEMYLYVFHFYLNLFIYYYLFLSTCINVINVFILYVCIYC